MKSKPAIIAVLASIACTGLPLQAQPSEAEMMIRATSIGYLAATRCFLRQGIVTQEKADAMIVDYVTEEPKYRPGIIWGQTTTPGTEAVQAMAPYFNNGCQSLSIDPDEVGAIINPYISQ